MSMCKSLGIFYWLLHPDYMFSRHKIKSKRKWNVLVSVWSRIHIAEGVQPRCEEEKQQHHTLFAEISCEAVIFRHSVLNKCMDEILKNINMPSLVYLCSLSAYIIHTQKKNCLFKAPNLKKKHRTICFGPDLKVSLTGALLIWRKPHTMCWSVKDVQSGVLLPQSTVLTAGPVGKSWTWK